MYFSILCSVKYIYILNKNIYSFYTFSIYIYIYIYTKSNQYLIILYKNNTIIYLHLLLLLLLRVQYVLGYYLDLLFCPYHYQHLQNDDCIVLFFLHVQLNVFFCLVKRKVF